MRKTALVLLTAFIVITPAYLTAAGITIDTSAERAAISKYIYGTNQDLLGGENFTLKRFGGNRTTGYNWENNYSNAGEDWYNTSDTWLCSSSYGYGTDCNSPGGLIRRFHQENLNAGMQSIITVPMAGYVAADQASTVTLAETAPSARWKQVVAKKGSAFAYPPNQSDGYVYVDEEVNYLVSQYGSASTANGVKFYNLDNEPALWDSTHPRIHPVNVTCVELVQKSVDTAKAIKDVDPAAQTFGGVFYGWGGYRDLNGASDWNTVKGSYIWYIQYFLAQMKAASDTDGRRLLDAIDLHYYSEARDETYDGANAGCRVTANSCDPSVNAVARMLAPRTLWDPTYKEASWVGWWLGQYLPLIPKVQSAIDTLYPGTKLTFTEHAFGGGTHVSGGVAMADTLGIFGKYGVYAATYWDTNSGPYTTAGVKIFTNYDGANSNYGDTKVKADFTDSTVCGYASINGSSDSELHIVIINKYQTAQVVNVTITSASVYNTSEVWGFDSTGANITLRSSPVIGSNKFVYTMPATSVLHFVLYALGTPTETFTPSRTYTNTATPTRTDTVNPLFTATNTFTPTATLPPVAPEMIDNLEDGDNLIINQGGRNGPWYNTTDGTSTQVNVLEPGTSGSAYARHYSGSGFTDWGSGVGFNLVDPAGGPQVPYDATMYTGIRIRARIETGSSAALRVQVPNADTHPDGGVCGTGCWDAYGLDLTLTTSWAYYDIPFSSLTQGGWGYDPGAFNAATIYNVEFRHGANVTYDVWLDDIQFYGLLPTPTNTYTPSSTSTASFTATRTATATASRTATPTDTATATRTGTSSPTASDTVTAGGNTFTNTPTGTNTLVPSFTHTYTATGTYTGTPTGTRTATGTNTGTPTSTSTATQTATQTWTGMPSNTFTATFTYTGTQTPSFSATSSPTSTQTNAVIPSPTNTATDTNTALPAATFTDTATLVYTPTSTPTPGSDENVLEFKETPIPFPNPVQTGKDLNIAFKLSKSAAKVSFRLYTVSFRLIKSIAIPGDYKAGGSTITVPGRYMKDVSPGIYLYVITARDDMAKEAKAGIGTVIILK